MTVVKQQLKNNEKQYGLTVHKAHTCFLFNIDGGRVVATVPINSILTTIKTLPLSPS